MINSFRIGKQSKHASRTSSINDGLLKYVIFTEIPDSQIYEVVNDRNLIDKCDAIAFLYDNDQDHIDFIRNNISKFSDLKPKILIQTKSDLI